MFRLYKCNLHQAEYRNLNYKIKKLSSITFFIVFHSYSFLIQGAKSSDNVYIRTAVTGSCFHMYGEVVYRISGVPRGGLGVQTPPSQVPKALQNRAKLTPIVKTVKNC